MLDVRPADRRVASAVRRFPPGCGRPRNAAAQKPLRPHPSSATKPPLPNPSARAAATTTTPLPGGTVPAAEVTVRRASALRRYPPGCGRGVSVPKPPELVVEGEGMPPALMVAGEGEAAARKPPALVLEGEDEASVMKPQALVLEGEGETGASKPPSELCIEAKENVCDREAVFCECAIDDGDFSSDGWMEDGGSYGDAAAQEEGCGKPSVVTDLMTAPAPAPFLPWAQHGRSQWTAAEDLMLL